MNFKNVRVAGKTAPLSLLGLQLHNAQHGAPQAVVTLVTGLAVTQTRGNEEISWSTGMYIVQSVLAKEY